MTSAIWVLCALAGATTVDLDAADRDSTEQNSLDQASVDALLGLMSKIANADGAGLGKKKFPMDYADTSNDAAAAQREAFGQGEPMWPPVQQPVATPRPFLAQAQADLAALQNIHAAPQHELDAAAAQSAQELAALERPHPMQVDTTWVDHTAEDIAANRKKVHDVAEKIKRDFFSMKLPQPPASLIEVPSGGPGESLIQHSIALSAADTVGDTEASAARAKRALEEDSKHLEENFEKSFEQGMQEGFTAEKQRAEASEKNAEATQAAEAEQEHTQAEEAAKRNAAVQELERQSEQSLRAH